MERAEFIATNIGDLVVALSEEAASYVHDEREVNKLVAFMLTHLLNNSTRHQELGNTGSNSRRIEAR